MSKKNKHTQNIPPNVTQKPKIISEPAKYNFYTCVLLVLGTLFFFTGLAYYLQPEDILRTPVFWVDRIESHNVYKYSGDRILYYEPVGFTNKYLFSDGIIRSSDKHSYHKNYIIVQNNTWDGTEHGDNQAAVEITPCGDSGMPITAFIRVKRWSKKIIGITDIDCSEITDFPKDVILKCLGTIQISRGNPTTEVSEFCTKISHSNIPLVQREQGREFPFFQDGAAPFGQEPFIVTVHSDGDGHKWYSISPDVPNNKNPKINIW